MLSVRCRRGNVALEYAIVLPALLLFILGIMDGGRLLFTYTTLYRAAEAAARCAAINNIECGTEVAIQNRGREEAWGLTISPSAFAITTPSCGVQVKAVYTFTFITPGFGIVVPLGSIPLNATACYPL